MIWRFCVLVVLILYVNDVRTEYTFTIERRINKSDIVTFRQGTDAKPYLPNLLNPQLVDLDKNNRTQCIEKNGRNFFGDLIIRRTVVYDKGWGNLDCMSQKEILSSTYFFLPSMLGC